MDKLAKYKSMRSADKTPEPFGKEKADSEKNFFVVQKHAATALHYDFRLEVGGVMPSWAVPKGPSLDATVKRLAMKTEDHPLDYRHFEGVIPEGEYGAGEVIIWDEGTYFAEQEVEKPKVIGGYTIKTRVQIKDKNEADRVMLEGIEKGEIKFYLMGRRLKGSFALVKTRGFGSKRDNFWLLIKHKDRYMQEDFEASDFKESVVSGKTLSEIGENG